MGRPTPLRAIEARRIKATPELLANIRRRYEHTPRTLSTMAADLGCSGQTVCNIAKREGWVRFVPPPRDLSPAARLLARAEALSPLIPAKAGTQERDGDDGECGPGAPLSRGRTDDAARGTRDLHPQQIADTAEALHDAAVKLLADVKASRAQLAGLPQSPLDQERAARTLANLTATLQKLAPLRGGVPLTVCHTGNDYDDMPADLDAFRDELARRIDALLAEPPDEGDRAAAAGGDAAPPQP